MFLAIFLLVTPMLAAEGYWQFVETKTYNGKNTDNDTWIYTSSGSGSGAILEIMLSQDSPLREKGQKFQCKASWTIPAGALVPGQKLHLSVETDTIENGLAPWGLRHNVVYSILSTDPGPNLEEGQGENLISLNLGTGDRSARAGHDWTVPNGSEAQKVLYLRIKSYPTVHRTSYKYAWIEKGNPPAEVKGPADAISKENPVNNEGAATGASAKEPDTSVTFDDNSNLQTGNQTASAGLAEFRKHLRSGINEFKSKNWSKACESFEKAVQLRPAGEDFSLTGIWRSNAPGQSFIVQDGTAFSMLYVNSDFAHLAEGSIGANGQIRTIMQRVKISSGTLNRMEVIYETISPDHLKNSWKNLETADIPAGMTGQDECHRVK